MRSRDPRAAVCTACAAGRLELGAPDRSPCPDDLSGTPSLDASLERGCDLQHRDGGAAGIEGPELLVAVLRHPRADGVDPYAPLEAECGSTHEAFDAAVCDGEAGRLRDRIV